MGGYFKPQRRKIGVVTPLMACLFAAGWVKSLRSHDEACCLCGNETLVFVAADHGIFYFGRQVGEHLPRFPIWISAPLAPNQEFETAVQRRYLWICRLGDFRIGINNPETPSQLDEVVLVTIPFWSIVIPLTLVSAWLFLSKPMPKRTASQTVASP